MQRPLPIKVGIHDPGRDLGKAIKLIETFRDKNNIGFDMSIKLDFSSKYLGYFMYDQPPVLYVNPTKCNWRMRQLKEVNLKGHPQDCSLCGVITHEFCHFIDDKFGLVHDYKKKDFTRKRLCVTKYAKTNVHEELAELMTMYMINPFILSVIDKERFDFLAGYFKSPSPNSKKRFLNFYKQWRPKIRKQFRDEWKLNINVKQEIVERRP